MLNLIVLYSRFNVILGELFIGYEDRTDLGFVLKQQIGIHPNSVAVLVSVLILVLQAFYCGKFIFRVGYSFSHSIFFMVSPIFHTMNTPVASLQLSEQQLYGEALSQTQEASPLSAQEQGVSAAVIENLQEIVDPSLGFLLDLSV